MSKRFLKSDPTLSTLILVKANELRQRLEKLADRINRDYADREIDLVCLSNSAMTFTADLVRLIEVPVRVHILAFISYPKAPKSGEVRITLDVGEPLQDRHVLMVEGMIISGRTPLYLMNLLRLRQPASIELCAIGMKPRQLAVELLVKYHLFEFDQEWVAGYGIGHGPEKVSGDLLNMAEDRSMN
ncbi:phosphoribosyltransferase family protein [bacterium]|nr:phosphoribosyltransferase family protein [bacterium]